MAITFTCPECQCKMSVPDALAGKRGKCSKCKAAITVPGGGNGQTTSASPGVTTRGKASPPLPKGPARTAPSPPAKGAAPGAKAPIKPATPAPPPAAKAEAPPDNPDDLEAAALAALADEPAAVEARKATNVIEFECPMCFEPLKLPVDLGGKKHPCEHCRRIITVPVPKVEQRSSWRDTGPNLPSAARRDDGPAPEGVMDANQTAGPNTRGWIEEGIIEGKHKPLTFLQKRVPYILLGSPVLILLLGGVFLYGWMARNKEKQAFDEAVRFAEDAKRNSIVGAEGVAALNGDIGLYYLRGNQPGCSTLAQKHLNKAIALASSSTTSKQPLGDALLLDLIPVALDLGGNDLEKEGAKRLSWDETQKVLRNLLTGIRSPEARLEGLRRAVAGLVERGQTPRTLVLVAQLYSSVGADRCEALGVAGLELFRLGKKDMALKAAEQTETPYTDKKGRPALRSSVVALAITLDRAPPTALKNNTTEDEDTVIGNAEGLAYRGRMDEARQVANKVNSEKARIRGKVAVAAAATDRSQLDLDDFALKPDLSPWLVLRLLETGIRVGVPVDRLEATVSALPETHIGWGQLLLLRARLSASSSTESAALDKLPATSLPGRVALLEVARHNTRHDSSWPKTVKNDEDGAKAFISLGVALGLQKGK